MHRRSARRRRKGKARRIPRKGLKSCRHFKTCSHHERCQRHCISRIALPFRASGNRNRRGRPVRPERHLPGQMAARRRHPESAGWKVQNAFDFGRLRHLGPRCSCALPADRRRRRHLHGDRRNHTPPALARKTYRPDVLAAQYRGGRSLAIRSACRPEIGCATLRRKGADTRLRTGAGVLPVPRGPRRQRSPHHSDKPRQRRVPYRRAAVQHRTDARKRRPDA